MFPSHGDEALYLVFVLVPDVLVDLHFVLQAFRKVNPIHALAPSLPKRTLLEHLVEFVFGPVDVFVGRVKDEVVVLGEDGDEGGFLDI